MKYRIITNGLIVQIQYRKRRGWYPLGYCVSGMGGSVFYCHTFASEELATQYVTDTYGSSAERVREWRTV